MKQWTLHFMLAVRRMAYSKSDEKYDLMDSKSSSLRRRQLPLRQKTPVLFFLTIAILLSFSLTVGETDNVCDGRNEDIDGKNYHVVSEKGEAVDVELEQDSIRLGRATTSKIKIIDPMHNLPELLTSPRSNKARSRIWIVLAYRDTCEFSVELLRKLRNHAIPSIEFNSDNLGDIGVLYPPEMNFVPMPIDENDIDVTLKAEFLNRIGIARLPSLFFLCDEDQEQLEDALLLENIFTTAEVYRGRSESISDLVNGLYHYLSRLQLRTSSTLNRQEYDQFNDRRSPLAAIRVESLQKLRNVIRNTNEMKIFQNPPLPLDPDLSQDDQNWIRYLMDDDSNATKSSPYYENLFDKNGEIMNLDKHDEEPNDGPGTSSQRPSTVRDQYYVIVQCRNYMGGKMIDEIHNGVEGANLQAQRSSLRHSISQLYQEYHQAIKVLGTRRDVLFSILEPDTENLKSSQLSLFCDSLGDDGLIRILNIHSNESLAEVGHDDDYEMFYFDENINNTASRINYLSSWLRPEVLWFDRRMIAPIAFHPRYRRHAILFVDLHDRAGASETRDVIRLFRQECRELKKKQQSNITNLNSVLNLSVAESIHGEDGENNFVCLIVPVRNLMTKIQFYRFQLLLSNSTIATPRTPVIVEY